MSWPSQLPGPARLAARRLYRKQQTEEAQNGPVSPSEPVLSPSPSPRTPTPQDGAYIERHGRRSPLLVTPWKCSGSGLTTMAGMTFRVPDGARVLPAITGRKSFAYVIESSGVVHAIRRRADGKPEEILIPPELIPEVRSKLGLSA